MKRMFRTSIVLGTLLLPSIVHAQDTAPSAEEIKTAAEEFDTGRRAFKAHDYVEAAEHFESADQSAPSATALELAIRSRDRAGQLERAATLSALAEKRHPDEASLKTLAESILKRARAELHEAKVTCSTPCDLVVDNKLVHGRATSEWTVFFDAGNHQLRAGWPGGRSSDEEIVAQRGGSSETAFEEPPPETRKPQPREDVSAPVQAEAGRSTLVNQDHGAIVQAGGLSPVIFFTGVGLTAVLGGLTIWSGIDTIHNPGKDRVRSECAGQGESCSAYQDGLDKQRRTNLLAAATGVIGVGTVLVGLLGTDWSKKPEQAAVAPRSPTAQTNRARIEPWVSIGSGAAIGAAGRF